ncbi:helix-turn-helix transcriptional regulator [Sphingobacterium siyangense]|uniref:AraC-like DNA-binding protein n=1 Tax=Sphingobacterium siyangense TaxID=459529 RepID=A0A562MKC5_9SPHI|nr:AraC family transcriptional regulator [Sphingobacterium siyangense]TWI20353.1 AraC-like DNA-binding protein [Sphingobacterium siyangense]
MEEAYTYLFQNKVKKTSNVLNDIPDWIQYPLLVADEAVLYEFRRGRMLSQKLSLKPFQFDLIEYISDTAFSIKLKINRRQIFFYFLLAGNVTFRIHNGEQITQVKANNFYMSYNLPCTITANAGKGQHIGLVISIELAWIKQFADDFHILKRFIQEFEELPQFFKVLPHCRMDKKVHTWLQEIYSFTKGNKAAIDGLLRLYISLALEYYHTSLKDRERMRVYCVKKYLDENFTDQKLSCGNLAELFCFTERTLRNQFKCEFHVTIHGYYTKLRLEKAKYLIETQKMLMKDVFYEVGYKDESSFRYAYTKFLKKN